MAKNLMKANWWSPFESNRQLALADLMDEIKDIPGVIVVSLISNYLDEK